MTSRNDAWAEIEWIDEDGQRNMWTVDPFKPLPDLATAQPILTARRDRHQNNIPGSWYSHQTRSLIPHFSQLERRWIVMSEFDANVFSIVSQPFRIHIHEGTSRVLGYVPDLLLIGPDGPLRCLEIKPERFDDTKNQRRVNAARPHLKTVSIELDVVHEPDPQTFRNVEFLSHFRRPNLNVARYRNDLIDAAVDGIVFGDLLDAVGPELLVRPAVFNLMWNHELEADLTVPLSLRTTISRTSVPADAAA